MKQHFLKPMLPTLAETLPVGVNWVYEVKYDGFRCLLYWDENTIIMTSRNGHPLHEIFPEIPAFLSVYTKKLSPYFPFLIDGELCILENPFKASFELVQKRGRLKSRAKIKHASSAFPSSFCAFDLLTITGKNICNEPFLRRKEVLIKIFGEMDIPAKEISIDSPFNYIPFTTDLSHIQELVVNHHGEGIVAKKTMSKWSTAARTPSWIKVKNLKMGTFFLLGLDTENGFFHVGILKEKIVTFIGLFAHGITDEEKEALVQIVKKNQSARRGSFIEIKPSICVELSFLELYKEQLRQPRFIRFRFDVKWEDCTWESLQKNN
ncbi:RNA ligase family protein [Bacillus sp. NEB1478]|uniref:ATP-dependent DNA ligase n=1 Tax=Bacillus sp. NEB1478 TaxID=3073816 RepID=UPI002872CEC9|nr:RNA ligase family protein [Bacillus sp. NEB1478]WNB90644.1 RNA ligase family protein [Bacillus sp. NEB1478]